MAEIHGSFPDARGFDMDAAFWWAGADFVSGQRVFRRIVFLGTITYPNRPLVPPYATLRNQIEPDETSAAATASATPGR